MTAASHIHLFISTCGRWACASCSAPAPLGPVKEPVMGDIGRPVRHIELEPVEQPTSVPAEPAVTPEREEQPA